MKKEILYIFALLLLTATFISSCKKDLSVAHRPLTDSTGRVSTVITGLYNYIAADDAGNIYALRFNYGADTIYKIDSLGNRSLFYTPPVTIDHDTTVTNTMGCLTIDSLGNLYTINYNGNMTPSVLKITPSGSGSIIFSNITPGNGSQVEKIAVNQGNFYFSNNVGVHKITAGGSSSVILNSIAIFTVNRDGIIYYPVTTNTGKDNLGQLSAYGNTYTYTNITLPNMIDLTTDKAGHIYTSDVTNNDRSSIHVINRAITKDTTIISSLLGHADGPLATAKIGVAFSLTTNNAGSLYFTEITGNPQDIRKISY